MSASFFAAVEEVFFAVEEEVFFAVYDNDQKDYRSLILSMLFKRNLREEAITDAILSSVVPRLYSRVLKAVKSFVPAERIIEINPNGDYGITLDTPEKDEVGDDLIVMNAYAYHLFPRELIVISMGTCTVINHISAEGSFQHCIIAPGLHKVAETLWGNADQLPKLSIEMKDSFLANTTVDAMNIGIYKGYVGMLEYLVKGMINELGSDPFIVACGGLGKKIAPFTDLFDYYRPDLVTEGLVYLFERENA